MASVPMSRTRNDTQSVALKEETESQQVQVQDKLGQKEARTYIMMTMTSRRKTVWWEGNR